MNNDYLHPKWDEAGKVHDWRNYINAHVQVMWESFNEEQKFALYEQADEQASNEKWD